MTPLEYAERIAYSSKETLYFTYETAKKYSVLPGLYVEAGVAAGAQIIAMAYAAPNKTIFAFDSFQGIPYPSNRDDQMPGITMLSKTEQMLLPDPGKQVLETTGATSVSEADFWHNIDTAFGPKKHNIKSVKGWFENTIPVFSNGISNITKIEGAANEQISILRLDGDLYNSTWVCLQHLFPKVIKGGCVIIDDWTLPGCQAACKEYFELIGYEPDYKFLSTIAYFYK